jgi:hypothetical protein
MEKEARRNEVGRVPKREVTNKAAMELLPPIQNDTLLEALAETLWIPTLPLSLMVGIPIAKMRTAESEEKAKGGRF